MPGRACGPNPVAGLLSLFAFCMSQSQLPRHTKSSLAVIGKGVLFDGAGPNQGGKKDPQRKGHSPRIDRALLRRILPALPIMGDPAFVLRIAEELPEPPQLRGLVLPEPSRLIASKPAVHPAGIKAVSAIQNALQHCGGVPGTLYSQEQIRYSRVLRGGG